jgi:hypothetical protein
LGLHTWLDTFIATSECTLSGYIVFVLLLFMISGMRSSKAFLHIFDDNSLFRSDKGFGMLLCAGFRLKLLNV